MKEKYLKLRAEIIGEEKEEAKKNLKRSEVLTYYALLLSGLAAVATAFFSWPLAISFAAVAGNTFYQRIRGKRIFKATSDRLANEEKHLESRKEDLPENNPSLDKQRKAKYSQLMNSRKKHLLDNKSANEMTNLLSVVSAVGSVASTFLPALIPLTVCCAASMIICGETHVKLHKENQTFENQMNNLTTDIRLYEILKIEPPVKKAPVKTNQQAKTKQAVKTMPNKTTGSRVAPRAAVNTENERLVDAYLRSLENQPVVSKNKQKIK